MVNQQIRHRKMSYFYLQSKSLLLLHQTENISLAAIISLIHLSLTHLYLLERNNVY